MTKIAICEDEDIHAEILKEKLKVWATDRDVSISIKRFPSGESFLFQWEDEKFDLLILDIQMGELTGMDVARKIREKNESIGIIFITSKIEYALKGYEVGALSYMMKPTEQGDVSLSLNKFYKNFHKEKLKEDYLNVVANREVRKIRIKEIVYCVVFGHYIDVITKTDKITYIKKISELETELPNDMFVKCHRSYLVNFKKIEKIFKDEIVMENGDKVPIARGKKDYVMEKYIGEL